MLRLGFEVGRSRRDRRVWCANIFGALGERALPEGLEAKEDTIIGLKRDVFVRSFGNGGCGYS